MEQLAVSELQQITVEIRVLKQQTAQNIIEIGKRLKQVKDQLEHGRYMEWLNNEVDFDRTTAARFIQVCEQFGNVATSQHLNAGKLFELISLPESVGRQEFIEQPHMVPSTGETKTIDEMTVKELREVKRQLKQAQEQLAATNEQAQSIIERDRQLREENERLKAQKNPEPKVVEKVVQVTPPDYERVLREHQALNNKNVELTMQIDQIQTEYHSKLQDIRDGGERATLRDLRKGLREQLDVLSWHQNGALMTYKAYLIGNPEAVKAIREFLDTYEQKTTETIQKWRDALNAKTEDETIWTII